MAKNLITSRQVLYPGSGDLPDYRNGTKVTFHFKTVKLSADSGDGVVIDDSKECGQPMELIIGKQFKLILWEEWIKNMRLNEVSRIVADKQLCTTYPFVSKCYRKFCKRNNGSDSAEEEPPAHHCCAGMALNPGMGYKDLDDLVQNGCDLEFTIELLKVERPEDYDKQIWQMSAQEMLDSIPEYRNEANALYNRKEYSKAADLYSKALAIVEQLVLREKPGDEDWQRLDEMKIPLLSNLSQCRLIAEDFYAVIEYTTEVLKRDPNNTKALFRRAKAHRQVWNLENARQDLSQVLRLDPTLERIVTKEFQSIESIEKSCKEKDLNLFKGKLFS